MNADHASPPKPTLAGADLPQILEALLFVGAQPVSPELFGRVFPEAKPSDIESALQTLRARYRQQQRPYSIVLREEGYRLELIEPYLSDLAEKTRGQRTIKLSRPAIDILSVIAYRQPIDKEQVREIIGFDPSAVLRQLQKRGILAIAPADELKSPPRYITAPRFLELFGLDSLADFPAADDLEKL